MNLEFSAKLMVVAKDSKEFKGKTYYNIAVLQNAQAGTVSCDEDVFKLVEPMNKYDLGFVYNDAFKSIRVTRFFGVVGGVDTPSNQSKPSSGSKQ